MDTTLVFSRSEGENLTSLALVKFTSNETKDPHVLIGKFKSAVTKWINTTKDGAEAWAYSCEDFNIGDFAGHDSNKDLKQLFSEQGISVEIILVNEFDASLPYDTILANKTAITPQ